MLIESSKSHQSGIEINSPLIILKKRLFSKSHQTGIEIKFLSSRCCLRVHSKSHQTGIEIKELRQRNDPNVLLKIAPNWNWNEIKDRAKLVKRLAQNRTKLELKLCSMCSTPILGSAKNRTKLELKFIFVFVFVSAHNPQNRTKLELK